MKALTTALAALLIVPALFAARSSAPTMAKADPHDEAMMNYQSGERRLDKIAKMHEELKAANDPKAAEKLKNGIQKQLQNAAADFKRAVASDPNLYQGYSELGFTLRKMGSYDESLAAYNRALELQPGFAPAIEYRAEAYLGLNRVEEAKQAYTVLFQGDRARADVLLDAMKQWVAERGSDPAAADFAKWVGQRETIHKQTPTVATRSADIRSW